MSILFSSIAGQTASWSLSSAFADDSGLLHCARLAGPARLATTKRLKSSLTEYMSNDQLLNDGISQGAELMDAGEWQESSLLAQSAELPGAAPVVPFSLDYAARLRALAAVSASHM